MTVEPRQFTGTPVFSSNTDSTSQLLDEKRGSRSRVADSRQAQWQATANMAKRGSHNEEAVKLKTSLSTLRQAQNDSMKEMLDYELKSHLVAGGIQAGAAGLNAAVHGKALYDYGKNAADIKAFQTGTEAQAVQTAQQKHTDQLNIKAPAANKAKVSADDPQDGGAAQNNPPVDPNASAKTEMKLKEAQRRYDEGMHKLERDAREIQNRAEGATHFIRGVGDITSTFAQNSEKEAAFAGQIARENAGNAKQEEAEFTRQQAELLSQIGHAMQDSRA